MDRSDVEAEELPKAECFPEKIAQSSAAKIDGFHLAQTLPILPSSVDRGREGFVYPRVLRTMLTVPRAIFTVLPRMNKGWLHVQYPLYLAANRSSDRQSFSRRPPMDNFILEEAPSPPAERPGRRTRVPFPASKLHPSPSTARPLSHVFRLDGTFGQSIRRPQ